jgi:hypothetical protein
MKKESNNTKQNKNQLPEINFMHDLGILRAW